PSSHSCWPVPCHGQHRSLRVTIPMKARPPTACATAAAKANRLACSTTCGELASAAPATRPKKCKVSTLKDIDTRRIATRAVSAFGRAQRWRCYLLARALGKPSLPCRPPGSLGVWCFCLPGIRISVGPVGNAGADLELTARVSWLADDASVVTTAG